MNSESPADESLQTPEISARKRARKRISVAVVWPIMFAGLALLFAPQAYSRFALSVVVFGTVVILLADTFLALRFGEVVSLTGRVIYRSSAPSKFYCYSALYIVLSVTMLVSLILSALKIIFPSAG